MSKIQEDELTRNMREAFDKVWREDITPYIRTESNTQNTIWCAIQRFTRIITAKQQERIETLEWAVAQKDKQILELTDHLNKLAPPDPDEELIKNVLHIAANEKAFKEQFEKWAAKIGYSLMTYSDSDRYQDENTSRAYVAWCAAITSK